jgi:DNA-binding winged helix-turn-helix (wHTH) protein/tetratricopeptide (TPR) repeat protein
MTSAAENLPVYRFGTYEADTGSGELLRKGVRVRLQEQPFRLLCLLLESAGKVVTREAVRAHLWPGNTYVDFDASLSVAVGKLREALGDDSENPRYIETIPKRGYRFVAPVEVASSRATAVAAPPASSEAAFSDAPATDAGVAGTAAAEQCSAEPAGGHEAGAGAGGLRNMHLVAIVLIAAVLVVGFMYRSRSRPEATAEAINAPAHPQVRRAVAVMGFRNLPGRREDDWLGQAFTEMIGTELAAGSSVRLISDEDVSLARHDLGIGEQDSLAKATLERLGKNPGADIVILGNYTPMAAKDGNRVRLDIRVQDTRSGETIAENAVTGKEEDLFEMASRAGAELRKSLNISSMTTQEAVAARASLPANQKAVRFYSEGLEKARAYDSLAARDLLQQAVAADENFPLAHAALGDALGHLGYVKQSLAEAKRALDLSAGLSTEERLSVEASYRGKLSDYAGSMRAYGELFRLRPDNLEYGLALATAQYHVKREDALQTLQTLRKLPPPEGEDLRIDLVEASAEMDHDFAASQAAVQRAIAKAEAEHSPLRVAQGYGILCQAGPARGMAPDEFIGDCEKAIASYTAAGQKNNVARTSNDLAGIYFLRGELRKSESMWEEAAKVFRAIGDSEGLAATSNNLGAVYFLQGKLPDAKKMLEQALAGYRVTEDGSGVVEALNDLGGVAWEQGKLVEAEGNYHQAAASLGNSGDKSLAATVGMGLGDIALARGDFGEARKQYQQSLELRTQVGEEQTTAESQVALARLSIEEGHAADAEGALRKAAEQFEKEKQADDELSARTELVRALAAQGKSGEAAAEAERGKALAANSDNEVAKLGFALASAEELAGAKHAEAASGLLVESLTKARELGLARMELEIRLAQGDVDRGAGKDVAAQAELAAVEKAARARGFALIANKAASAGVR